MNKEVSNNNIILGFFILSIFIVLWVVYNIPIISFIMPLYIIIALLSESIVYTYDISINMPKEYYISPKILMSYGFISMLFMTCYGYFIWGIAYLTYCYYRSLIIERYKKGKETDILKHKKRKEQQYKKNYWDVSDYEDN